MSNSKTSKPTLEDYIFDMETRPPDMEISPDGDLWTQLKKKEADLVLAAELGKALLDKNNELTKLQERIVEEYNTKIEVSLCNNIYQRPINFLLVTILQTRLCKEVVRRGHFPAA